MCGDGAAHSRLRKPRLTRPGLTLQVKRVIFDTRLRLIKRRTRTLNPSIATFVNTVAPELHPRHAVASYAD